MSETAYVPPDMRKSPMSDRPVIHKRPAFVATDGKLFESLEEARRHSISDRLTQMFKDRAESKSQWTAWQDLIDRIAASPDTVVRILDMQVSEAAEPRRETVQR